MKPTKKEEYNWSYSKTNSKGEAVFRHDTEEDFNFVTDFLDKKNIEYENKLTSTMLWIYYNNKTYSYYPTTGRWGTRANHYLKHYHSKGIEDFYTRFLIPVKNYSVNESIESVEKVLHKNEIDYVKKNKTLILTTKLIPRQDGRGNRKQYSYHYEVGGQWRPIKKGVDKKRFFNSGGIELFLKKYFLDIRTNKTFT